MRKIFFTASLALAAMLIQPFVTAQTVSQNIRYQAVLRDAQGYVKANRPLHMTLRLDAPSGTVYEETQSTVTDDLGQINVMLGSGSPAKGSDYTAIDWSSPMTLNVYSGGELLASMPVSSVPAANYASTAANMKGKTFDDDAEPSNSNYYSSAKMTRMMQGAQSSPEGQTALAKERKERIDYDAFLLDSISKVASASGTEIWEIWEKLIDTITLVTESSEADLSELWDTVNYEIQHRKTEDQKIWDSIARIKLEVQAVNFCEAGDPEHGIYTNSIPVVSEQANIGLFLMPELKVLKQSGNCDLFSDLNKHTQLDRSYKTRIMTYNTSGNALSPKEVYIPVGSNGLEVYVDNYLISEKAVYYTYDILVFDVEYYKISDSRGLMYVTLVRE